MQFRLVKNKFKQYRNALNKRVKFWASSTPILSVKPHSSALPPGSGDFDHSRYGAQVWNISQDWRVGVSGEATSSALSPRQWSVLSHCQNFLGERPEGRCRWQSQDKVLERTLSLFPFPSAPRPPVLRVERYMKPKVWVARAQRRRNTSSPSRGALWPGLGEGSSIQPEEVGEGGRQVRAPQAWRTTWNSDQKEMCRLG